METVKLEKATLEATIKEMLLKDESILKEVIKEMLLKDKSILKEVIKEILAEKANQIDKSRSKKVKEQIGEIFDEYDEVFKALA